MSTFTPTAADVIQFLLDDDRAHLFVALPATVESYDAAGQTVNCKPMTKRVARNADDDRLVDELPVLPAVPVVWLRAGGYFMTMPLAAGDGGLVVCCDSDLGAWRDSGRVSDPGDERRHSLTGAVFIPGLETVARALTEAATGHMVLGQQGGPSIHIDGSSVQLGDAGGQFVALANLVTANFNALLAAVAGVTPSGTETGLTALKLALAAPGFFQPVAATLTKAT